MRRIAALGIVLLGLSALAVVGATREQRVSAIEAAITRTPTQVEVTNFPTTQSVAGSVSVANLPLDAEGNVRISGGGGGSGPAAQLVELRFHETDRALGRLPLIALPAGYRMVSIFIQTTDATKAGISQWSAAFGSNTAPFVHYNIGDFQVLGSAFPLNTTNSTVPGEFAGLYNIVGSYVQLNVSANGFSSSGSSLPPPADTEYYVSLYLMP